MPVVVPGSVSELRARYGTIIPEGREVVKWPLYHGQTYAMAGQTILSFFNAVLTNKDLSNMEVASVLPAPKSYLLRALGVHLVSAAQITETAAAPGSTVPARANDIEDVFNSGHLEFFISNKSYLIAGPLGLFPSPVPFVGFGAIHFAQAMAADRQLTHTQLQNASAHRDGFLLDPPLLIESQVNFQIDLRWNAAVAVSAATNIFVIMLGQMIRPMQ